MLTKEQKKYRKEVIFPKEIERLQEKIDALNLANPLTIKKLYLDYNASHKIRSVNITFKENFIDVRDNHRVNKDAGVMQVFDGSGKNINGVIMHNFLCNSGVMYEYREAPYDTDIAKVCDILSNEYFIWLNYLDSGVSTLLRYSKTENALKYISDTLYAFWKRTDICNEGRTTKYDINTMIQKYREQIERGLIIDFPDDNKILELGDIPAHELTEREKTKGTIFG